MKTLFEHQKFIGLTDAGEQAFEKLEFRRCYFESCCLSNTRSARDRTKVRNVILKDCEQRGCLVDAAAIEDVVIDGLKTNGLLQTWGAVFKHVVLKGKVGRIMLSPAVATGIASIEEQHSFDNANTKYYEHVDWALDISNAEFTECDIRGIPSRLIRRDPLTQIVITRQKALEGRWRTIDLRKTYWGTAIEYFLMDSNDEDIVLVAPKDDRDFASLLEGLKRLREAGIAEAD